MSPGRGDIVQQPEFIGVTTISLIITLSHWRRQMMNRLFNMQNIKE